MGKTQAKTNGGIVMPGIGLGISPMFKRNSFSFSSYWTTQPEVLFFGLYSEIADGKMPNKVEGSTDWLTVAGAAGSETYQCPNTAPYIAADTDYIWFKTDVSQRTVTTAELVGYDLPRTPVKYDNISPNSIKAIMILSSDITGTKLDKLHEEFELSLFWSGVENINGFVKSNRGLIQSEWAAETTPAADPTGLTLTLLSGTGVQIDWTDNSGGTAPTEIWGKIDSGEYSLLYTIEAGTVTKNDLRTPESLMTYKIRAGVAGGYSEFTAEESIAMLGDNLVPPASSDFATDGSAWWSAYQTKTWNSETQDLTVTQKSDGRMGIYRAGIAATDKNYIVRFDAKSSNTTIVCYVDDAAGHSYTAIVNPNLSTVYQSYKFRSGAGRTATFCTFGGQASAFTDKVMVIDNIKIQEIL